MSLNCSVECPYKSPVHCEWCADLFLWSKGVLPDGQDGSKKSAQELLEEGRNRQFNRALVNVGVIESLTIPANRRFVENLAR